MMQKHILFWDRDADGIIWPYDLFRGFRNLGFGYVWSIGSLLIAIFFSYPTRLGFTLIPDPFFRIYIAHGQKSKHGSDSGVYTLDGGWNEDRFVEMFRCFDGGCTGGLSAEELWTLWRKNRVAWDLPGWCFAWMEWSTTWLLLQKDGRVWKDDLRACYDGSIFWEIQARSDAGTWDKGYSVEDFIRGMWKGKT